MKFNNTILPHANMPSPDLGAGGLPAVQNGTLPAVQQQMLPAVQRALDLAQDGAMTFSFESGKNGLPAVQHETGFQTGGYQTGGYQTGGYQTGGLPAVQHLDDLDGGTLAPSFDLLA